MYEANTEFWPPPRVASARHRLRQGAHRRNEEALTAIFGDELLARIREALDAHTEATGDAYSLEIELRGRR